MHSPNCRQSVHYEASSTSYDSYGRDVATDPNLQHTPTSNTNSVHWVRVVVVPCVSRRRHTSPLHASARWCCCCCVESCIYVVVD